MEFELEYKIEPSVNGGWVVYGGDGEFLARFHDLNEAIDFTS